MRIWALCLLTGLAIFESGISLAGEEPSSAQAVAQLSMSVHKGLECGACHPGLPAPYGRRVPAGGCDNCHEHQRKGLDKSVHGSAATAGEGKAPTCVSCHGSHAVRPVQERGWRAEIPTLCAQCHVKEAREFQSSIHGEAVARGIPEAPVCTDCHGEHAIVRVDDPNGPVYVTNLPKTCSACHESERLLRRYGIPVGRLRTFENSYHGVALKFGEVRVANCASCHGTHNIYPPSDPRSTISPARISQTCGRCHPGAGEKFAIGRVHIEPTVESSLPVFLVRAFYTWFIGILVAGFVLHVTLDLLGRKRRRDDVTQARR